MLGDFYFANNQLDKATAEYAALYQDHAKDMVVKKNYIQLLILKDRLDDARKLNDEVVKAKPDDLDAQVYKGEIEIRSGKTSDAVNTLQAVLKNDPDNCSSALPAGSGIRPTGQHQPGRSRVARCGSTASRHCGSAPGVGGSRHPPERSRGLWRRKRTRSSRSSQAAPDGYLLRAVAENRSQAVLNGG